MVAIHSNPVRIRIYPDDLTVPTWRHDAEKLAEQGGHCPHSVVSPFIQQYFSQGTDFSRVSYHRITKAQN